MHKLSFHVDKKLAEHNGFVKGLLLCGMSAHAGPECLLSALAMDEETSFAMKKLFSEYLGVPIGKDLRLLRRVSENLEHDKAGEEDSSSSDEYESSDEERQEEFDFDY
jgi:hypothetical protein